MYLPRHNQSITKVIFFAENKIFVDGIRTDTWFNLNQLFGYLTEPFTYLLQISADFEASKGRECLDRPVIYACTCNDKPQFKAVGPLTKQQQWLPKSRDDPYPKYGGQGSNPISPNYSDTKKALCNHQNSTWLQCFKANLGVAS